MKLRTEISWWFPGHRLVYMGSPKTRVEWIRLTWRAYLAAWHVVFLVACFLVRKAKPPLAGRIDL
jgi:hypothetical protein